MNKFARGFTLIELMIVVAVIAIIAAFAYPAYLDYVRKARRADAQAVMMDAQIRQERYRAYNNIYGTAASLTAANLGIGDTDYYDFAISNVSSATYTITATATGTQTDDSDCTPMTVNQSNTKTPAGCWKR